MFLKRFASVPSQAFEYCDRSSKRSLDEARVSEQIRSRDRARYAASHARFETEKRGGGRGRGREGRALPERGKRDSCRGSLVMVSFLFRWFLFWRRFGSVTFGSAFDFCSVRSGSRLCSGYGYYLVCGFLFIFFGGGGLFHRCDD